MLTYMTSLVICQCSLRLDSISDANSPYWLKRTYDQLDRDLCYLEGTNLMRWSLWSHVREAEVFRYFANEWQFPHWPLR